MAITLKFMVKDATTNQLREETYTAENTWMLRNTELLRHSHYIDMAEKALICPTLVESDHNDGATVVYRVAGLNPRGLMHYAVGSAAAGNVKMQGAYLAEMAYKRAFDSWVTTALGLEGHNIGSQEGVAASQIDSEEISHPELVKVEFGKNRGKTLGEIWTENQTFITDFLATEKFEARTQQAMFVKQAAIALIRKSGAIPNSSANIVNNTQQSVQQQPVQQQPMQQQSVQQQPMQQQPMQQQPMQQQPVQQQQAPSTAFQQRQTPPVEDVNVLKAELQSFWTSRGYSPEEAGNIIKNGLGAASVTWGNISIEQVKMVLTSKDAAFPIRGQASVQQPVVPQQPIAPQQAPMQQPIAPQQSPMGEMAYCNGNHSSPQLLKKYEIDFCRQNNQKFSGKMFCMQCQEQMRQGQPTATAF